jgi:hypothetical protein
MILHVDPNAPWYAKAAADAALAAHVGGGMLGIAAGFVTVAARKGGGLHRGSGAVFFWSLLVAYAVGAAVAPLIKQPGNMVGGSLAIYLLLTGWMTVRRPAGEPGRSPTRAFIGVAIVGALLLPFAAIVAVVPQLLGGVPYSVFLILAVACALAALSDWRVSRHGGLAGPARLRRHLWRMSTAFAMGTGSLFIGQPKVFPPAVRGSPLLILLAVAPLLVMAVWLNRTKTRPPAAKAVPLAPIREALS